MRRRVNAGCFCLGLVMSTAAVAGDRPALDALVNGVKTTGNDARIELEDVRAQLRLQYRPLLLAQAKARECSVLSTDEQLRFDATMRIFDAYIRDVRLMAPAQLQEAAGQLATVTRVGLFSGCGPAVRNISTMGWIQAQAIHQRFADLGVWASDAGATTTTGR